MSRHGGRDGSAARSPWLMLPYARALVMTGTRLSAQVAAPLDPSRMPPQGWVSSPKQFDAIKVASDFLMPTRDGKRMVTDIYRPARS
ncbi:hypothetical protein [Gemmatimonas sp.]|uniref:hypothetical protein n=1 Tax=Gemmatimonas sp. TaxID=1962908 RepID=UPI00356A1371